MSDEQEIKNIFSEHIRQMTAGMLKSFSDEMKRPSVIFRPILRQYSGSKEWSAEYNPDGEGRTVSGVGMTPDEAMRDFDRVWAQP